MVEHARKVCARLAESGVSAGLVNGRFIKPMDLAMLADLAARYPVLITLEENTVRGGFGTGVHEALLSIGIEGGRPRLRHLGLPDAFVSHGGRSELFAEAGLSVAGIADCALETLKSLNADA